MQKSSLVTRVICSHSWSLLGIRSHLCSLVVTHVSRDHSCVLLDTTPSQCRSERKPVVKVLQTCSKVLGQVDKILNYCTYSAPLHHLSGLLCCFFIGKSVFQIVESSRFRNHCILD